MPVKQTHHPVICFGETLWDMLPSGKQAGGAPMNVAYHLQQLGKSPAVISRVGNDALGQQLLQTLQSKNVCTEYVQVDNSKKTSVVTATPKNGLEMVYSIVEDIAWDYIEFNSKNKNLVKQAGYFVYGSLAARNKKSFQTLFSLLEAANKKVLDVNLRAPFYTRKLLEMLLQKANIVKLNIDELQLLAGWYAALPAPQDQMKLLKDKFSLESIIVTFGANGAMVNRADEWCCCEGLSVEVSDTIGSGDAFLAGLLSGFIDGADTEKALHFANRLAAFVATQKGACPRYLVEDIGSPHKLKTLVYNQHF